jgi:hypothetical protein
MLFDDPESFYELCARALREKDFETVVEIVDRILCAANENVQAYSGRHNRNARET